MDASFTSPAARAGFSCGWPLSRKGLGAIAFATLLAGCGGGGGGGGDGGGGGTPDLPPPETCLSQVGGGTGYAVGACINPIAARFLPVQTDVEIRGQSSYFLTQDFPDDQPAGTDGQLEFTSANRTTTVTENARDILGVVRGEAYENPLNATLRPPYTALTDFSRAIDCEERRDDRPPRMNCASGAQVLNLRHAGFGHWEKVVTLDPERANRINDSYFGVWYADRPETATVNAWPGGARQYAGRVVGLLSPTRYGDPVDHFLQSVGFSATITIRTDAGGRIEAARIENPVVSYQVQGSANQTIEPLRVNPILLVQSAGNVRDQALSGSLDAPGQLLTGTGEFEARWYGENTAPATEIAGRMRFTTTDGHYLVLGSFGAVLAAP